MPHSIANQSALKVCRKCEKSKPLSDFPANNPRCKECVNAANRASYRRHRDSRLEATRDYRRENLESVRAMWRESAKSKSNTSNEARARGTVSDAVRNGKLPPAWSMVCDGCQEAQAAEWHHHNGYEREHWLDVVARCLDCHGLEHSNV